MTAAPRLEIRLIHPDEIDAVSQFTVDAYASAYELSPRYREELAQVADRVETQQVWVAHDPETGELLGTVTTPLPGEHLSDFAAPGDMDFRMLAVAPAARGRGIGPQLVEHCKNLAAARGANRLVLHTGGDMGLAMALYERMGFTRLTEVERTFPFPPGVCYDVRVYGMEL